MAQLHNSFVSLSLDARGNLASLRNLRTGCAYVTQPGLHSHYLATYPALRDLMHEVAREE